MRIRLELLVDDLERAAGAAESAGRPLAEPPRDRPWGLRDFRVTDPHGSYLRVTTRS